MKLRHLGIVVGAAVLAIAPFAVAHASSDAPQPPDRTPAQIQAILNDGSWSPLSSTVTYQGYNDPKTREPVLQIADGSDNSAQAVSDAQATFGSQVNVGTVKSISLLAGTSRQHDTNPHWGGAAIDFHNWPDAFDIVCTSGFAVNGFSGVPFMIYAGHCQQKADIFGQFEWDVHDSNSVFYGGAVGLDSNFPDRDDSLLYPSVSPAEIFEGKIWTGPGSPNPRPVSGKKGAVFGDTICVSGGKSLNHCNEIVYIDDHSFYVCNVDGVPGCTHHLDVAFENGTPNAGFGDSGGPLYYPTTSPPLGAALATGILNGGTVDNFGAHYIWFTPIGEVLTQFGVTIKTCC